MEGSIRGRLCTSGVVILDFVVWIGAKNLQTLFLHFVGSYANPSEFDTPNQVRVRIWTPTGITNIHCSISFISYVDRTDKDALPHFQERKCRCLALKCRHNYKGAAFSVSHQYGCPNINIKGCAGAKTNVPVCTEYERVYIGSTQSS